MALKPNFELAVVDGTVGVGEIASDNRTVKVSNDGEYIVVDGVEKDEMIYVYNVAGQLMAELQAPVDGRVKVFAKTGLVYIVRVGSLEPGVKILH